ncbi:MAG: hypothetical protein JWN34_2027 [Bryobacterales bacterium]|nr:hypothetical protein [Bryobacterales bacterium]
MPKTKKVPTEIAPTAAATSELPAPHKIVAAIEAAEQNGGAGHEKLSHALDIVTESSGAIAAVSTDPRVAAIANLISFTVTALNLFRSGIFKGAK